MPGRKHSEISPIQGEEILKYTQNHLRVTKTIDASTVDPNHDEDPTVLYAGLLLSKITASNKYVHYTQAASGGVGSNSEANAVILYTRIEMDGVTDAVASCLIQGHINLSAVRFHSPADAVAFDWTLGGFNI